MSDPISPTAAAPRFAPLFADASLARRLERAEALGNAAFVDTRARLFPACGAGRIDVAGAFVLYDGPASPLTQTFGLGLFDPVTEADLAQIEAFYLERGAPVFHEVSPLADPTLLPLLNARGYHPVEFTSILFRPLDGDLRISKPLDEHIHVRLSGEDEWERWAQTAARGWSEIEEYAGIMQELAEVTARRPDVLAFVAERNGHAVATGALSLHDGVALLAGASTVPEARRLGAQLALLEGRLRHAAAHGCDVALMGAAPGSASQRNAERQGFRIAYTRVKWQLTG